MLDRVSSPGKEGRIRIRLDDGSYIEGTLEMADEPSQEGTLLNKDTLLSDKTASAIGSSIRTVDEALSGLSTKLNNNYSTLDSKITSVNSTLDSKITSVQPILLASGSMDSKNVSFSTTVGTTTIIDAGAISGNYKELIIKLHFNGDLYLPNTSCMYYIAASLRSYNQGTNASLTYFSVVYPANATVEVKGKDFYAVLRQQFYYTNVNLVFNAETGHNSSLPPLSVVCSYHTNSGTAGTGTIPGVNAWIYGIPYGI